MSGSSKDQEEINKAVGRIESAYWLETAKGLWQVMKAAPDAWQGPDGYRYNEERYILGKNLDCAYQGILISSMLFVGFRIPRSSLYKQIYAKFSTQKAVTEKTKVWKSYLERKAEEQLNAFTFLNGLPTDFGLSILCGCSATIILFKSDQFQKEMPQIPLMPGKSVVYEQMCPRYVRLFESLQKEYQIKGNYKSRVADTLQTTVNNCIIRSRYIRQQTAKENPNPDIVPLMGLRP